MNINSLEDTPVDMSTHFEIIFDIVLCDSYRHVKVIKR